MRISQQPQVASKRRLRVAQVVLLPWRNASVVDRIEAAVGGDSVQSNTKPQFRIRVVRVVQ